tara:strand:+ start:95 stop:283 length:189 start_codon:yes stop_codon:yes gene_type:complete
MGMQPVVTSGLKAQAWFIPVAVGFLLIEIPNSSGPPKTCETTGLFFGWWINADLAIYVIPDF